ncbi:MAG: DUF362 domain-containing protein [Adlercreutzia equolifaciens]
MIEVNNESYCTCYTNCSYDVDELKVRIEKSGVLDVVGPSDTVLVKPNWVQERHQTKDEWVQMITHPTVITAVVELLAERLGEGSKLIVGDSPMTPANFEEIIALMPHEAWKGLCESKGISFGLIDMRNEQWSTSDDGVILSSRTLPGDPAGRVLFNLKGEESEFWGKAVPPAGLYGASYDLSETNKAHDGYNNLYEMGGSVIDADVFVNLPKMKTHRKAGMTCSLKNLVGVSTNKNLLPHHTMGTPDEGGDQFSGSSGSQKLEGAMTKRAKSIANAIGPLAYLLVPLKRIAKMLWGDNKKVARNGGWWGNDTLWRTILDLNKVLFYGNAEGELDETTKKRYVSIVDGIVAGEGEGPLEPDAVEVGALVCGNNPVAVDLVVSRLMGFDYRRVPSVSYAFSIRRYPLFKGGPEDIRCRVDDDGLISAVSLPPLRHLRPAAGWVGHVELEAETGR